jgi:hypothetical protein
MSKRLAFAAFLFMLTVLPVALAQVELTETYTSENGEFQFQFPADWTVAQDAEQIVLTTTIDDSPFYVTFIPPSSLESIGAPAATSLADVIIANRSPDTTSLDDPAEAEFEDGRTYAYSAFTIGEMSGLAIASSFGRDGAIMTVGLAPEDRIDEIREVVIAIAASITIPDEGVSVPVLENYAAPYEKAIAELQEKQVIPVGGDLIFEEDYAFFSGQGNWFTALASRAPRTNVIVAGELTYTAGTTSELEVCALMARVVSNSSGAASRILGVGLDNEGNAYYADLFGSGQNDMTIEIIEPGLDLEQPHHFLVLAIGDRLTVYVDGQLTLHNAQIDERSGTYGIALQGRGPGANCEGRNLWAYEVAGTPAGVCEIIANSAVNRRQGPGTNFETAGQIPAGEPRTVTGQFSAADSFTWWQLEDSSWVRADVVTASGDCQVVPVVEP